MKKINNSGYTLVEIILAIAILGLVIVPILGFMTNSSGIITHADKREMALLIAQQRMEYIKSQGYDYLETYTTVNTKNDASKDAFDYLNYSNRYPDFELKESITGTNIKTIEIEISWNSADEKKVVLKSKLADR